jgi:hypothetical protein
LEYEAYCKRPSDVFEHIPGLCELARECTSVVEISDRSIEATWGLLQGLSENSSQEKSYLGIDSRNPSIDRLNLANRLSKENGIKFTFWCINDKQIGLEPVDLLFIDALHTYCHLTYQLETFSPSVRKYICMHDTSDPWGTRDDHAYHGDYSEYPLSYDRTKKGLWPAIVDFLERHPEWSLYERRTNNHGFTILKRKNVNDVSMPNYHADIDMTVKNKIILCSGAPLRVDDRLKKSTEADMSLIPFKKIFVATKDPNMLEIKFHDQKPSIDLIKGRGKQLDNLNFMIATLKNALNDPDVNDDDIILYKIQNVYFNDMCLIKKSISKILEGYNMVARSVTAPKGSFIEADAFFVRVGAIRPILKDLPLVTEFPPGEKSPAAYFTTHIASRISNVYDILISHSTVGFSELGFYNYTWQGDLHSDPWDKKNYHDLFK